MLSKHTLETVFIIVSICALTLNAAVKVATRTVPRPGERRCLTAPWYVERKEVALEIDSWMRYTLDSGAEWTPLFPGGDIIHLGPSWHTPYTGSMMHQLRCLDIIREQLTRPIQKRDVQPTLARHCMNYIHQSLMYRRDLQVDWYQYAHKTNALHPHAIRRCRGWRAVYGKVWENQREHRAWRNFETAGLLS